jgi:hypothetical protein
MRPGLAWAIFLAGPALRRDLSVTISTPIWTPFQPETVPVRLKKSSICCLLCLLSA